MSGSCLASRGCEDAWLFGCRHEGVTEGACVVIHRAFYFYFLFFCKKKQKTPKNPSQFAPKCSLTSELIISHYFRRVKLLHTRCSSQFSVLTHAIVEAERLMCDNNTVVWPSCLQLLNMSPKCWGLKKNNGRWVAIFESSGFFKQIRQQWLI